MADITMCDDKECKVKDKCYRYTAKACKYRQSYFIESPRNKGDCSHYWKVDG